MSHLSQFSKISSEASALLKALSPPLSREEYHHHLGNLRNLFDQEGRKRNLDAYADTPETLVFLKAGLQAAAWQNSLARRPDPADQIHYQLLPLRLASCVAAKAAGIYRRSKFPGGGAAAQKGNSDFAALAEEGVNLFLGIKTGIYGMLDEMRPASVAPQQQILQHTSFRSSVEYHAILETFTTLDDMQGLKFGGYPLKTSLADDCLRFTALGSTPCTQLLVAMAMQAKHKPELQPVVSSLFQTPFIMGNAQPWIFQLRLAANMAVNETFLKDRAASMLKFISGAGLRSNDPVASQTFQTFMQECRIAFSDGNKACQVILDTWKYGHEQRDYKEPTPLPLISAAEICGRPERSPDPPQATKGKLPPASIQKLHS